MRSGVSRGFHAALVVQLVSLVGDVTCQFLRRLSAVRILNGARSRLSEASAVRSARANHLAGLQPGHRRARRRLRTAGAGAMAERVSSRTRAATPCDAAAIARIY